ncbi:MAG: NUDIX hydrolase [Lachnospiraceae bacterium]|nr:NUDIX hydrolase [Lachnospiraceae bacterium]
MNKNDELKETTKESALVFSGKMLQVYDDTVILPDDKTSTREFVRHIGAVAVVPITEDGKVIMERQFRYPIDAVVREIPAGKLNTKDEDRLSAAKRELLEETGIWADEWIDLGKYYPAPAYSDEMLTLYLARGLHEGVQKLDEDEFLDIERIPFTDVLKDVLEGKITDGKTQVAIMKAALVLGEIH